MAISFTRSIIARLEKEIADIEAFVREQRTKREKSLAKISQLQRDQKASQSASDLSSKISREIKLKKDIERINALLTQSSKQLKEKQALLAQQRLKVNE
ncbi:hypothetical protein [Paenibacillus sp. MMS18-CY102]|uniref:hypothetical protein n=1 Tax=Paenibacillus sp. MMS18-CY102 TaxID=2682849 RepID=UPI00136528C2|nr:hypothetical protein [Paenibacillus sp. MMS18-CY102]MWC30754.1 hypothetical protein [Paenibacillus sp. MMS18-CY102]